MSAPRPAIYSGPNRSGVCVCGHKWDQHHLGVVMRQVMTDGGEELYIPQECEAYGVNEDGGKDADGNPHCDGYRDAANAEIERLRAELAACRNAVAERDSLRNILSQCRSYIDSPRFDEEGELTVLVDRVLEQP